jgi:hypothetical protein
VLFPGAGKKVFDGVSTSNALPLLAHLHDREAKKGDVESNSTTMALAPLQSAQGFTSNLQQRLPASAISSLPSTKTGERRKINERHVYGN